MSNKTPKSIDKEMEQITKLLQLTLLMVLTLTLIGAFIDFWSKDAEE